MILKREYDLDGNKKFWAIVPDNVRECAICDLLVKEYPNLFELISEFSLGGHLEIIYMKIKEEKENVTKGF